MLWLPDATIHDYGTSGGSWTDTTDPKGCLHTTEGDGWPSYDSGAKAPHATVMPIPHKGVVIRQHVRFDRAARALRNPPGGVQTNRDYVFQFELIGTCAKGGPGYYWPDADDAVLADLYRKVIKPVSDAFHIPLVAPSFLAYPASYGASSVRMSGSRFDHYTGWLGHEHAPENDHGDPGDFPWSRMIAAAGGGTEDDLPSVGDILNAKVPYGNDSITVAQALGRGALWAERANDRATALQATVAAQAAAIKALSTSIGVNADEVQATVDKAVKEALANVKVTLTTGGA